MRRRLLTTYLSLTTLVLLALEIPLALSYAMGEFHHLAIRQLNDTATLTSLVEPRITDRDLPAMQRALAEHERRTGVAAVVLSRDGQVLASSPTPVKLTGEREAMRVKYALSGKRSASLDYPYNLKAERLVVVEPIVRGTTVLGAVATGVSTGQLRDTVLARWGLLLVAGVIALAAAALAAVPLARWMLRPIERLDQAATALADGHHDARVPADDGPPEVRTLARAFNSMADRLEQLLATQRAFIADASHQLRNPLTALRLRVENLQAAVGDDHPASAAALSAANEAERLSAILDQLLALARADSAGGTPQPIDVSVVLTDRQAAWQVAADRRSVSLELDANPVVANVGPGLLEQMVDNLIDNALRFAPADSTIRLEAYRYGDMVAVVVHDEGPGMSPEELTRSTDRFWRSPTAQQSSGSGLGLSIVDRLARSAGGQLILTSAEPHGLRAEVTVPLLRLVDAANWFAPIAAQRDLADGAGVVARSDTPTPSSRV